MTSKLCGLQRNTVDKFYTCESVVKDCMEHVHSHIDISRDDLCIEPSAGNGAFMNSIRETFTEHLFFDIEPEHQEVVQQDYLTFDPTILRDECYRKIHVLGNPPFGRQSSLAIQFIKHSCVFADTVSFVLPKSFKKDSMKKHFPLHFHLSCEIELPHNAFVVDQQPHNVPCVFQIWEKCDTPRLIPKKHLPKCYTFVKRDEQHHISFRRVGVYAGQIDTETQNKSPQSHYFIRFTNGVTVEQYNKLCKIQYASKDDTVGPRSISKQELMKEFNQIF